MEELDSIIVTPFHDNTGLPLSPYGSFKAHSFYSIVPASDSYLCGKIPNEIENAHPSYRALLIEDAIEHYRFVLYRWEERDRDRVISYTRRRIVREWDGSGSDPENEDQKKSGISAETLETQLRVYEAILTFLAGESEWLAWGEKFDPYGPRQNHETYYLKVAQDFVSGRILDRIQLDYQLFMTCREYANWDHCYETMNPHPYVPTSMENDEVFKMDE